MAKQSIPEVKQQDPYQYLFDKAIKDNIEQLTGVKGGPLTALPATATTAEIIAAINAIVARLNK